MVVFGSRCFFSSRRRHTRCALVTGVHTCALPISGLIDFEVSSFGDPAAELSGLRLRDAAEPLGDLSAMIDRYEMLTGDRISKQLLEYNSAGFCGVNGFTMWGLAYDTTLDQDYIAYMHYAVATTRWAIKAIAAHRGLTRTDPEETMFRRRGFAHAGKHR